MHAFMHLFTQDWARKTRFENDNDNDDDSDHTFKSHTRDLPEID